MLVFKGFMKIVGFVFTFLMSFSLVASHGYTLEPYDAQRDWPSIEKIIKDNASHLAYESLGCPEGTTKKYIESKDCTIMVARLDNNTIGFVSYRFNNLSVLTFHIERSGIIELLGVDSVYRRKGAGRALLERACKELETQKVQHISLSVNVNNCGARALYEKCDFKCVVESEQLVLRAKQLSARLKLPLQLPYRKETNTPANELAQGNIIQRYLKNSLAVVSVAVAAYYGLKS